MQQHTFLNPSWRTSKWWGALCAVALLTACSAETTENETDMTNCYILAILAKPSVYTNVSGGVSNELEYVAYAKQDLLHKNTTGIARIK